MLTISPIKKARLYYIQQKVIRKCKRSEDNIFTKEEYYIFDYKIPLIIIPTIYHLYKDQTLDLLNINVQVEIYEVFLLDKELL